MLRRRVALVVAVLLAVTSVAAAPSASAAGSGSIAGTVRDGVAGAGLAGVAVRVDGLYGAYVATTGADGTYQVSGVEAGTYAVCFDSAAATGGGGTAGYGDQCWKDVANDGGMAWRVKPVKVASDQSVTGVDGHLPRDGAIRGVVTGVDGTPLGGVQVSVEHLQGLANAWVETAADGSWQLSSLPPGDYRVCFGAGDVTVGLRTGYLDRCTGQTDPWFPDTATPVRVARNAVTTDDMTLPAAGRMTGRVVDSAGRPVKGVTVGLTHANDEFGGNSVGAVQTRADGSWTFAFDGGGENGSTTGTRIYPGHYTLYFGRSGYVDAYYPASYSVGDNRFGSANYVGHSEPVSVTAGATTTTTMTVLRGAVVSGQLADTAATGVAGSVDLRQDGETLATVEVPSSGQFTIVGVPPGSYDLCANPTGTTPSSPAGFLKRCTDAGADGVATPVGVDEARSVAVRVTPTPAAGVTGVVTTTDGRPLRSAHVDTYVDGVQSGYGGTDASGRFRINRLTPGPHSVCVVPTYAVATGAPAGSVWAGHCLDAAPGTGFGRAVSLTAGAVLDVGTVSVPYGAVLTGAVWVGTDEIVPFTLVTARGASGSQFTSYTDGNGRYRLVLPADRYTICAPRTAHGKACYSTAPPTPASVKVVAHGDRDDLDIRFAR